MLFLRLNWSKHQIFTAHLNAATMKTGMAFEFSDVADDNFHANLSTSINLKHLKCFFEIGVNSFI